MYQRKRGDRQKINKVTNDNQSIDNSMSDSVDYVVDQDAYKRNTFRRLFEEILHAYCRRSS